MTQAGMPTTRAQYYRARYYDASVGRFLSEDPIRFNSNTVNFYAYVENNPINAIDPEGERTQVCCRRLRGILGLISGQQHCYIDVQNDGHHYIFGLHKDKKLGGILRGGDADLPYPPGLGPDPSDAVKHPDKQCSDVTDATPCKERYLIEHALNPINCRGCGHNYHLLGPNSNTYVSDTLNEAGMTPPPEKRAPGYNMH
jgi:RHS repeat-associated protein